MILINKLLKVLLRGYQKCSWFKTEMAALDFTRIFFLKLLFGTIMTKLRKPLGLHFYVLTK